MAGGSPLHPCLGVDNVLRITRAMGEHTERTGVQENDVCCENGQLDKRSAGGPADVMGPVGSR